MNAIQFVKRPIEARTYRQLVDGELRGSASGARLERLNPAHDVKVGDYPLADVADTDEAVAAARRAFDKGPWPKLSGN